MAAALIVEDDEPIRSMLAAVVRAKGFTVETACDGQEAIEKLQSGRFDVIVLDLMMPKVNGYDVLRHLSESQPHLLERVIIATAVPEREVRRNVTQPVFGVHHKPFELARLLTDMRLCAKAS